VNLDGQYLLTGHYAAVLLWELPTGNQLAQFSDYRDGPVTELVLSPDDKYFLTMACDRTTNKKNIAAFELPAGKCMQEFAENTAMCWPVAFSADGKLLATGYRSGEDWSPRVWRMPAGELVCTQVGHSKFRKLEFSPDGRMLLSADSRWKTYLSYIGCERYFSFMNPECNSTDRYSTGIHRGTFTPDSRFIVAPHRSTIAIIDVFTRQPAFKLDAKGYGIEFLSFTADGRYLVMVSSSTILVYEPK